MALTGGLEMVMTATPSARTSMMVVPLAISGSGSGDAAGPEQEQCVDVERRRVDQQACAVVLLAELTEPGRSLSYTDSVS